MSLICGILSRKKPELASAEALETMLAMSRHRAQDGQVTFVDPVAGISLAYCHTATFGNENRPPAWHEAENLVATVEGDVYEPSSEDGPYKNPHAGALLENFLASPADFPTGLDGHFSFFLWDRQTRTLHIGTDRMGHKLLYYYHDAGRDLVVLSTEMKGVLAHPTVPRELDTSVLPTYLVRGLTSAPLTLAKGIRRVRAAERLSFGPRGFEAVRHWHPASLSGPEDFDFWRDELRTAIIRAARLGAAGSQRIATFLSGGVDSSVALAALKEAGAPEIASFTLSYGSQKSAYDVEWARKIAAATGSRHEVLTVDPEKEATPEVLSTLMRQINEPFIAADRAFNDFVLNSPVSRAGYRSVWNGAAPGFRAFQPSVPVAEETSVQPTEDLMNVALISVLVGPLGMRSSRTWLVRKTFGKILLVPPPFDEVRRPIERLRCSFDRPVTR